VTLDDKLCALAEGWLPRWLSPDMERFVREPAVAEEREACACVEVDRPEDWTHDSEHRFRAGVQAMRNAIRARAAVATGRGSHE